MRNPFLLSLSLSSCLFLVTDAFSPTPPLDGGNPRTDQKSSTKGGGKTFFKKERGIGMLDLETRSKVISPKQRSDKAKETWTTVALHPTSDRTSKISIKESATIYNEDLFEEFLSMKGTYYINGLSTCEVGDRLVHPFEAHGYCKSLVFDGKGQLRFTSKIIETPLTKKERSKNRILCRGVMSSVGDYDSLLGNVKNALSSSQRDTANLVANLWPPPQKEQQEQTSKSSKKGQQQVEPLLITCTDNGEPYALDPKTLETKGRLVDVVPKLRAAFPFGTRCLAHTRYDEQRQRFIMCTSTMDVPGETFEGNVTMAFLEFDTNFDLVSRREHTTRFMVCHDWVLTQNYYVVPKNPAYLKWENLGKFIMGKTGGTDIFAMEEETNGQFMLIPRHDPSEPVHDVESDSFFNLFHFGPSYETNDGDEMIINGCIFDSYKFGAEMGFDGKTNKFDPIGWGTSGMAPAPRLDQFVVDMKTMSLKKRTRIPLIPVDMPVFNGDATPLRYSYFLGASRPEGWFPFRSIVKLDIETYEYENWDSGDGSVVSEPMFIPRPTATSEDDGYVISIVHDSEEKSCRLMVWDSQTFGNGPIASCPLGDLVPWCVHGSFNAGYNPFEDEDEKKYAT